MRDNTFVLDGEANGSVIIRLVPALEREADQAICELKSVQVGVAAP